MEILSGLYFYLIFLKDQLEISMVLSIEEFRTPFQAKLSAINRRVKLDQVVCLFSN